MNGPKNEWNIIFIHVHIILHTQFLINTSLLCGAYMSVNLVNFGSDNGLSPIRLQAII